MKTFNVLEQPLENSNLVEASAGTGKTYSVAILVLRLIIEKDIPVSRILTVTFTNAAVAEMAGRIRSFIGLALKKVRGNPIDNVHIIKIVKTHLKGNSREKLAEKLNQALVQLDEASIQTIHSFCQESLSTFAFETGQAYGMELKADLSDIVSEYVDDYWRIRITQLSLNSLMELNKHIKIKVLYDLVKQVISGKTYYNDTQISDDILKQFENTYTDAKREYLENKNVWMQEIDELNAAIIQNRYKPKMKEMLVDFDSFLEVFSSETQYVKNVRQELFNELTYEIEKIEQLKNELIHGLYNECIDFVKAKIHSRLKQQHLLTYDDMIGKLHKSVMSNAGEGLRKQLREKYDAIFIDEFQDTDKLQYEIYDQLYGEGKILFYIGDPKQSIYSWRKADLNTYFKAAEKVGQEKQYTMNTNYRSSHNYVAAMNHFFGDGSDHFLTSGQPAENGNDANTEHQKISYIEVNSAQKESRPGLEDCSGDVPIKPLEIFTAQNKSEIKDRFIELVRTILGGQISLNGIAVKPSDIGVLVRIKQEGTDLKRCLARKGIKAITIDETNVFSTQEAEELQHILESVLDISYKGVNKALFNSFTGISPEELLQLDDNLLIDRFKHYQQVWMQDGLFRMMREYMQDFRVVGHLTNPENGLGLRYLTNLNQLLELLQEAEFRQELKPTGLLSYLNKQRTQTSDTETVYTQRIESDEDAVTIMTIHKAKGLQFPIVIAPFMDLTDESKHSFRSYRNLDGDYLFYHKQAGSEEAAKHFRLQTKQENRRLLYVTLTRAQYNCFLFKSAGAGNSTISDYIQYLQENPGDCTGMHQADEGKTWIENLGKSGSTTDTQSKDEIQTQQAKIAAQFALPDANWWKLSFSAITLKRQGSPKPMGGEPAEDYDRFVFHTLPRGASMGDLLHYVFERIDFREEEHRTDIVQAALRRFYPNLSHELCEPILELIQQVTQARISLNGQAFALKDIESGKRVSELEFDMPLSGCHTGALSDIPMAEDTEILAKDFKDVQGLLNGLVDLFFEHQGKYYVLDWKSNYLGDQLSYYEKEGLLQAMNQNNYHLQYLLYTHAIKRFLEQKVAGFDYETQFGGVIYMFLRGIRADKDTGIYTIKPGKEQMAFLDGVFR